MTAQLTLVTRVLQYSMLISFRSALALMGSSACYAELPEPGPEDGGLRCRLLVKSLPASEPEGFDVRLDLVNTSDRSITLRARWQNEDSGDVKDYIEAATSIECVPAIAPWIGGVQQGRRESPQPDYKLKKAQTLSMHWQTEGRKLKNRVTNPNEVQNPTFPFPGLYSVHATVDVITDQGTVRLRSNEQLVPVAGSQAMPKYTLGQLWSFDAEKKTAVLGLGSLHKIKPGDIFEIGTPKGMHWKLSITTAEPQYSAGALEMLTRSTFPPYREPPPKWMQATLVRE